MNTYKVNTEFQVTIVEADYFQCDETYASFFNANPNRLTHYFLHPQSVVLCKRTEPMTATEVFENNLNK